MQPLLSAIKKIDPYIIRNDCDYWTQVYWQVLLQKTLKVSITLFFQFYTFSAGVVFFLNICSLIFRICKIQRQCLTFVFTVLDTKLTYCIFCNKVYKSRKYKGVSNSNPLFLLKRITQQNILSLYRSYLLKKIQAQLTK